MCYPAHAQKKQWSICSLCAQFELPHSCVLPCTRTKKVLEHLQSLCSIWVTAPMCATLHTHKKSIGAFAVSVLNLGYRTHECYPAHAQKKHWSICSLCAQFGLPHPCVLPCTCTKKALEHLQSLCSIWLIPAPHLNVQTCSHLHMPCWLLVLCVGCVFVKLCPCAMSAQGSIHVMK